MNSLDAELKILSKGKKKAEKSAKEERGWKAKVVERKKVDNTEDIESNPIIDTIYRELNL